MVNKIIDGISIKIDELFGETYCIYSEDIEQGFNEPCFFISLLQPRSTQKLGNRSYREYNFDIHYFPSLSNEKNKEMNNVSEILMTGLEYITVNESLIRGNKIRSEVVNNVLHFYIKYSAFVIKNEAVEESMDTLIVQQKSKR